MKTIGIKLADGTFFPVMEEGSAQTKKLQLTTAHNNQTRVMVDLYRSATGSMDDAEYIDTLQIENLNKHPNGEVDLSFQIALDENNELTANIIDPETGAESDSEISLINRTAEERLTTDDYTLSEAKLATVDDFQDPSMIAADDNAFTAPADESLVLADIPAAPVADDIPAADDSMILEDIPSEPAADDSLGLADLGDIDIPTDSGTTDETIADDNLFEAPAEPAADDAMNLADIPAEPPADDSLGLADMPAVDDFAASDTISDDNAFATPTDTATDDFAAADDISSSEEVSDLADLGDIDIPTDTSDSGDATETIADENIFDTPADDSFAAADDSLGLADNSALADIPSMDNFAAADSTPAEDSFEAPADTVSDDSVFAAPADDFAASENIAPADDIPAAEENIFDAPADDSFAAANDSLGIADTPAADDFAAAESIPAADDIFDAPADPIADDASSEPVAAGNALSFTGLYDKETEMGESASHEDSETKKKIKIPMFVCIGCAAVCILVTILLLIFLPTKYELKSNVTVTETSAGSEAIAAKENEIIVITDGDKVTPVNNTVNRKGVSYKIKWGDTLWDIADTYYKNPWKYKKIASYNGIRNPDHIISGTVITIPAE
jgi:nucleoid-associated protein YgaU